MASKNVHECEFPDQAIIDLGFEDGSDVGFVCKDVETIYLSESVAMYDKIKNLLITETTSDLTLVKRAFILPMHNVSLIDLKQRLRNIRLVLLMIMRKLILLYLILIFMIHLVMLIIFHKLN